MKKIDLSSSVWSGVWSRVLSRVNSRVYSRVNSEVRSLIADRLMSGFIEEQMFIPNDPPSLDPPSNETQADRHDTPRAHR